MSRAKISWHRSTPASPRCIKCGQVVLEGHIRHCLRDGLEHGDADPDYRQVSPRRWSGLPTITDCRRQKARRFRAVRFKEKIHPYRFDTDVFLKMRFKSRRPAHGYMRRRSDFSDYPEVFLLTAFKMNTPITKMGKSVLKLRNPTGSPKSRFASINKPTNQAATVDNTAARYILSAPFVVFLETAGKKTVKTGRPAAIQ